MSTFESGSPENPEGRIEGKLCETKRYLPFNPSLRTRYERIAKTWATPAFEKTRRDDLIPKLLDSAQVRNGNTVLEAMCGMGIVANVVKEQHPDCDVYGLDFCHSMLDQIPSGIAAIEASVIAMPFPDACFDRVILRSALYDLPRRMQLNALREIRRILKQDGVFAFQTYHTTRQTQRALNEIVNLRDKLAGQYEDMGEEFPRYYATTEELEEWFAAAGFGFERRQSFASEMRFRENKEISPENISSWAGYMLALADDIKEAIHLEITPDKSLIFDFPGAIYTLQNKA